MNDEARPSAADLPCLFRIQADGWTADRTVKRAVGWHRTIAFPLQGDRIVFQDGEANRLFEVERRAFSTDGSVSLTLASWDEREYAAIKRMFDAATRAAGVEC